MSGSGISWATCKSAPRPRQITMPAPHNSVFLQARCPSCCSTKSQSTESKYQSTEERLCRKTVKLALQYSSVTNQAKLNTATQSRQPFSGLFSKTTLISWHPKSKPFCNLIRQEMTGLQWHQLDHMQTICTSLQTDNHSIFYGLDALPATQSTVSKH